MVSADPVSGVFAENLVSSLDILSFEFNWSSKSFVYLNSFQFWKKMTGFEFVVLLTLNTGSLNSTPVSYTDLKWIGSFYSELSSFTLLFLNSVP